jgi:hypothetical protein
MQIIMQDIHADNQTFVWFFVQKIIHTEVVDMLSRQYVNNLPQAFISYLEGALWGNPEESIFQAA